MVGVSLRKFSQVPTKKIERNIRDVQLLAMSQPYPKEAGLPRVPKSHHLQEEAFKTLQIICSSISA
jgi:hypothetical protein